MNTHTKLCLIRLSASLCNYYITFYIHTQTHTRHYTEQRQTNTSSCAGLCRTSLCIHTQSDIKNWFMGTIYTFQCRTNSKGLTFSTERLKVNSLICYHQEQTLLARVISPLIPSFYVTCRTSCITQCKMHRLALELFNLWLWSVHTGIKKKKKKVIFTLYNIMHILFCTVCADLCYCIHSTDKESLESSMMD